MEDAALVDDEVPGGDLPEKLSGGGNVGQLRDVDLAIRSAAKKEVLDFHLSLDITFFPDDQRPFPSDFPLQSAIQPDDPFSESQGPVNRYLFTDQADGSIALGIKVLQELTFIFFASCKHKNPLFEC